MTEPEPPEIDPDWLVVRVRLEDDDDDPPADEPDAPDDPGSS